MASRSNGGEEQLWKVVSDNSEEILRRLNANSKMLRSLADSGLISRADERKLESYKDAERRNAELLQIVLENDSKVPHSLDKFIDALNKSDQQKLASKLKKNGSGDDRNSRGRAASPPPTEKRSRSDRGSVNAKPEKGKNTKEIDTYLQTEARRTKYGAPAPGPGSRTRSESVDDRNGPRGRRGERSPDSPENDGGRPARRQSTSPDRSRRYSNGGLPQDGDRNPQDDRYDYDRDTGMNGEYVERSRQIIDKLHNDCDDVAKKNADLLDKLRHVSSMVQKVNTVGIGASGGDLSRDGADGHTTTRKQDDEAERCVVTVRDHVSAIIDDLRDTDEQTAACESLVEKLRNEVAERNMALVQLDANEDEAFRQRQQIAPLSPTSKHQTPLPTTTHQMSTTGFGSPSGSRKSRLGQLRSMLANLSSELDAYIHREKQHTLIPRWPGREAGPHRNFDQIDHDFNLLMREVRQNDRQSSVQSIQRLSDVTKTERDDCIRICDDIQRLVQKRRQKIQELLQQHQKQNSGIVAAGGKNGEPLKASPVLQRKVRTTRSVESNVSRRIVELGDEIKLCIELEFDLSQKVRDDFARRRIEFDERAHAMALDLKRLERRAKEAEAERERYRRLYEQAQIVQMSRLLTRPTIVKRSKGRKNEQRANTVSLDRYGLTLPTIGRRGSNEDPIPSQSLFVTTRKNNKNRKERDGDANDDDDSDRLRSSEPDWYRRQNESGAEESARDGDHHQQVAVHLQTRPYSDADAQHDQYAQQPNSYGSSNVYYAEAPPASNHHQPDAAGHRQGHDNRQPPTNQRGYDDTYYNGNGYYGSSYPQDGRQPDDRQPHANGKGQTNGYHSNAYRGDESPNRQKGFVPTVMDVAESY